MSNKQTIHNLTFHPKQWDIANDSHRFRIAPCGRRFGKTELGSRVLFLEVTEKAETQDKVEAFAAGATFWHTEQQWSSLLNILPPEIIKPNGVHRAIADRRIELYPDITIWFRSAENPDSLRSKGLDILWGDEFGLWCEDAWNFVRPALMDRHGKALLTGTPKGKGIYFKLAQRENFDNNYKTFNFDSYWNTKEKGGFLDKQEIDMLCAEMPQDVVNQEIYAAFIENVGTTFRNVTSHVRKDIMPYQQGEKTFAGLDLAKHQDFTVLCALRDNGELVGFDRFSQLDWVFQQHRILSFSKRFNANLLLDSTGIGDPIYDELSRSDPMVAGYKFTNTSKKELIENLSIMFDNNQIWIPDNPVLISELQLYSYEMTASGLTKYGAPEGYHDDAVTALALAAWQLKREPQGDIEISFGGRPR